MPKLSNFSKRYGKGEAGDHAANQVWEDSDGLWHGSMKFVTSGEDSLQCAHQMANAMRDMAKEEPDHSKQCECILCSEWKIHDAQRRLG